MAFQKIEFKIKEVKSQRKIKYSFQALGVEMEEWFGKHKMIWPLFHKKSETSIRDAYKVCRNKGIRDIRYLFGILKNDY